MPRELCPICRRPIPADPSQADPLTDCRCLPCRTCGKVRSLDCLSDHGHKVYLLRAEGANRIVMAELSGPVRSTVPTQNTVGLWTAKTQAESLAAAAVAWDKNVLCIRPPQPKISRADIADLFNRPVKRTV